MSLQEKIDQLQTEINDMQERYDNGTNYGKRSEYLCELSQKRYNLCKLKLQDIIYTLSYYNAAEGGQWSNEAQARRDYKLSAIEEIKSWGYRREDFEYLYDQMDKGLTTINEFNGVFNE